MPPASMQSLIDKVERFLRDFDQELRRAVIGGNRVQAAVSSWDARRKSLEGEILRAEKQDLLLMRPEQSPYRQLVAHLNTHFQRLAAAAATAANNRAPLATGGVSGHVNKAVTGAASGLAKLDLGKEAEKGIKSGVEALVREHLGDKVPANVRSQLASTLASEAMKAGFVQEGLYWAQEVVIKVALYLDRRLTISGELGEIKKSVEKRKTMPPEEVEAVTQAVGPRANAAAALDKQLPAELERTHVKFKTHFKVKPKFDLNPAVLFIKKIDTELGLTISSSSLTFKLGATVTLEKPLTDPSVIVNPHMQLESHRTGTTARVEFRGNVTALDQGTLTGTVKQQLGRNATLNLGFTGTVSALDSGKVFGNVAWNISENAALTAGWEKKLDERGPGTGNIGLTVRF